MFYRLPDYIALRSWSDVQRAYYVRNQIDARPLSQKQFEVMLLCDGEHDISLDSTVLQLEALKLIMPCDKGEHSSQWSSYRKYDNKYFPKMNLMITGKCNYNCLHCFNAADNAPIMTEWSFEDIVKLLDQCVECGINAFTITGGEPMAHKHFIDILTEIHKRNMFVAEINTNGFYITQDILDKIKAIGCRPHMKISFDGVGHHDYMRNFKGAEEIALNAMKLCVDNGFDVMSQTQVHRKNLDSMLETAKLLESIGVYKMRIIRTTETPRWAQNAPDASLPIEEYYDSMLELIRQYIKSDMHMILTIWQFAQIHPKSHDYVMEPVYTPAGTYRDSKPVCKGSRAMIAVTSSGEIVPCNQVSGVLKDLNISMGNLHDKKLKELISGGTYLERVCQTVADLKENSSKCGSCKYFVNCTGGCRAMGLLYSGKNMDFNAPDITKCYFFENGWHKKLLEALEGWTNLSPMDTEII